MDFKMPDGIPPGVLNIINSYLTENKLSKKNIENIIDIIRYNKKIVTTGNIYNLFEYYLDNGGIISIDIINLSKYKETYPTLLKLLEKKKINDDELDKIFININKYDENLVILSIDKYKKYVDIEENVFLNYILPRYIENNKILSDKLNSDYKINLDDEYSHSFDNVLYKPYITNNTVLEYVEKIRKNKKKEAQYIIISNFLYYRRLSDRDKSYIQEFVKILEQKTKYHKIKKEIFDLFVQDLYSTNKSSDSKYNNLIEKLKKYTKQPYSETGANKYLNESFTQNVAISILQMNNISMETMDELKNIIFKEIKNTKNIVGDICVANIKTEKFFIDIAYPILKNIDIKEINIGEIKNKYIFDYFIEKKYFYDDGKLMNSKKIIDMLGESIFGYEIINKYNLWDKVDVDFMLKNPISRKILFSNKYINHISNCMELFIKYLDKTKKRDKPSVNKIIREIEKYKLKTDKEKKLYATIVSKIK